LKLLNSEQVLNEIKLLHPLPLQQGLKRY